jgi:hypothetical protein
MANEQYAFLPKSRVPDRSSWQSAIDAAGFNFQLDLELQPFADSGFVPCKLHGRDSGFEIYYDESAAVFRSLPGVTSEHDYCISFRWGGDMSECACVLIASYILAKDFGATISYAGEPPYGSLQALLADVQAAVEDANRGA